MALVIDTLDLLHKEIYDAFVIVASDSDYTPLAIRLHESGVYVMGVGEKKTPSAFRNACDEFLFLENMSKSSEISSSRSESKTNGRKRNCWQRSGRTVKYRRAAGYSQASEKLPGDKYQDDDRYVNVSSAGQYIKTCKTGL